MTLSVLMSVYNKDDPAYLSQTLKSLCAQTLRPSEVVLVEDGPISEELTGVIERYRTELLIKSVKMADNGGLAVALNEGLKHCRYDLVARMDSDDICLPERFEAQVKFMKANNNVAVSSAWVEERDRLMQNVASVRRVPSMHSDIVRFAKRRNPVNHPVSIFRKRIIIEMGGYPNIRKAQDYALWSLMIMRGYRFANIPQVLLKMRTGSDLMSRRGFEYLCQEIKLLKLQRECGFLSCWDYFINLILRSTVRLQPLCIKRIMYRVSRKGCV